MYSFFHITWPDFWFICSD